MASIFQIGISQNNVIIWSVLLSLVKYYVRMFLNIACDNITINCPRGSQCKVDETVHQAYCEASCDLDNGGCADDEVCSVLELATCINPPCPSRILCTRMLLLRIVVIGHCNYRSIILQRFPTAS